MKLFNTRDKLDLIVSHLEILKNRPPVVRNTLTVILPMKQCPKDSSTATFMYVNGWNDAMKYASVLVEQLRTGVYEPVGPNTYDLTERRPNRRPKPLP